MRLGLVPIILITLFNESFVMIEIDMEDEKSQCKQDLLKVVPKKIQGLTLYEFTKFQHRKF